MGFVSSGLLIIFNLRIQNFINKYILLFFLNNKLYPNYVIMSESEFGLVSITVLLILFIYGIGGAFFEHKHVWVVFFK